MNDIATSISGVARAFDHLLGWSFADCNCPNCEQARKELANARLIAASPRMLKALRAIESCLSPDDNDYAAREVRAAIAEAEGSQP